LVDGFLRQRLGLHQPVAAVAFGLGQSGIVDRAGEIAFRLGHRRLEGARIDHKQNIAGLDLLAVMEPDLSDAAGNLGPDLGIIDRVDAAGELGEGMNCLGCEGLGGHRHRLRRRNRGIAAPGMKYENTRSDHQRDSRRSKKSVPFQVIGWSDRLADELLDPGEFREIGHGRPLILYRSAQILIWTWDVKDIM
jgi:hypothetical protein